MRATFEKTHVTMKLEISRPELERLREVLWHGINSDRLVSDEERNVAQGVMNRIDDFTREGL